MIQYYAYPKCSTCQKGKKWLESNGAEFDYIDNRKTHHLQRS